MAHEITDTDTMFSVREKPWHGIGDVLEEDISVDAARDKYLTWLASKTPLYADVTTAQSAGRELAEVPNRFGVLREDTRTVLGVVGSKYKIYQNSDMWDFIDTYIKSSGMRLETAGSLKGGQYTWTLLKGEEFEVVKGDPLFKYFLFRNSFTGAVPVSTLFTNIRVVCNNTLTMALSGAENVHHVRHVGDVVSQVAEVERAMTAQKAYQEKTYEALQLLSKREMVATNMKTFLENNVFVLDVPAVAVNSKVVQLNTVKQKELIERQRIIKMKRDKKVNQVLDLVETGAGADLPGVKGTAYGLFQAVVEWTDHNKMVRTSLYDAGTARFENAMFTSAKFKTDVLTHMLKAA